MCKRIFFLLLISPLFSEINLENLSLQKAEAIALEKNKSFQIAEKNKESAQERKYQAVSKWLPAIGYRAEVRTIEEKALYFDIFSPHLTFGYQGYSSILELKQPIFSSDLLFGLKQSGFELTVYEYRQAETQNELLRALRDHYYLVIFYDKKLEIEKEQIEYLSYALKQEEGKLNSGNATPFEVNQSKAALANSISLYYSTLKDLKDARNRLILTMGVDPLLEPKLTLEKKSFDLASFPEIEEKLSQIEDTYSYSAAKIPSTEEFLSQISRLDSAQTLTLFSKEEVTKYLELAFLNRPDLLAEKVGIEVAKQNVNLKIGNYLPKISGYAHYSYNDVDLGTRPFFDQAYKWSAGLVLSWNLFDSMLKEHEVREARAKKEAQKIRYTKEWQRVEVEVRNGLYRLEEALFTYLSSSQGVFVAEQAAFQAKEKLVFGKIPPLTYRDAVNHLFLAKNQQNRAAFDLLASYYEIRYATGMDLSQDSTLKRLK